MLDVRRLRALREVSERGTIAAAAEALVLTPSAVSQQLSALEREVGEPLVEPNGRTVRLTPAAGVLLEHADVLFAQIERLEADLLHHRGAPRGTVRVAGFATGIAGVVAPAAGRLRAVAPDLRLHVTELETPEAFAALARREVDVVVGMVCEGAPGPDDARFTRRDLGADPLDVALPADHALAASPSVALAALSDEDWVAPPSGWSCEQVVRAGCAAAGFTPRVHHRSSDWLAVLAMVGAGFGVSLVPRLAQLRPPPGVALRPVAGTVPCRHLFAACRGGAEASPAVAATLDALARVDSDIAG
jgi:DNA-binding transcriptional LysR family regulator